MSGSEEYQLINYNIITNYKINLDNLMKKKLVLDIGILNKGNSLILCENIHQNT